ANGVGLCLATSEVHRAGGLRTLNTAFEDISSFLPQSPGWMHSGVALLADGDLVCAHPEGHSLLRINLHEGTREIPTSLTEMHSIVAATWRNREVIAVADPGHRFVPDPRDGSQYVEYSRDGRA